MIQTKQQAADALAQMAKAVVEIFPRKHALKQEMLAICVERLSDALAAYEAAVAADAAPHPDECWPYVRAAAKAALRQQKEKP